MRSSLVTIVIVNEFVNGLTRMSSDARHMGSVSFHLASLFESKLFGNVARHIVNSGYVASLEHRRLARLLIKQLVVL